MHKIECENFSKFLDLSKVPNFNLMFGTFPGTCRAWDHPYLKEKPKIGILWKI